MMKWFGLAVWLIISDFSLISFAQTRIERSADVKGGPIKFVAIANIADQYVVTAAKDGNGNLEVIAWKVSRIGLERKGTARAGSVSAVSIASYEGDGIVTAVRNGEGKLQLIAWRIGSEAVTRRGSAVAEAISGDVSVVAYGPMLATAARNAAGKLQVIRWRVRNDGTIERQGEIVAGSIDQGPTGASLSAAGWWRSVLGPIGIYTTIRNGGGKLQVTKWRFASNGQIEREMDGFSEVTSDLASTQYHTRDELVTVSRDSEGKLLVILWSGRGDELRPRSRHIASGAAGNIGVADAGPQQWITSVRDDTGNLKLTLWEYNDAIPAIRATAHAHAGKVGYVAICSVPPINRVVTAVRNSAGDLQLTSWWVLGY